MPKAAAMSQAESTTRSPPIIIAARPPTIYIMLFKGDIAFTSSPSSRFFLASKTSTAIYAAIPPNSRIPSAPDIFISVIIMSVATAAPRLHQMSRLKITFSVFIGHIIAETPTTIRRLKILEPITLLNAISLLPESPAEMLTAASGALVPMATMVKPIITDGTFSSFAVEEAPSTKKSAPFISKMKPTINRTYIINKKTSVIP